MTAWLPRRRTADPGRHRNLPAGTYAALPPLPRRRRLPRPHPPRPLCRLVAAQFRLLPGPLRIPPARRPLLRRALPPRLRRAAARPGWARPALRPRLLAPPRWRDPVVQRDRDPRVRDRPRQPLLPPRPRALRRAGGRPRALRPHRAGPPR